MKPTTHLALLLALASACTHSTGPTASGRMRVAVAPLSLPDVGVACYDLAVTTASDTVWHEGDPDLTILGADQADDPDANALPTTPRDGDAICSDDYGNDAGGDIVYVGTCDASPAADVDGDPDNGVQNRVTLWVDGLYDSGRGADLGDWRDPCPTGCALEVDCVEDTDTLAAFDLTIMRRARQGFFDVAVDFDDIFCSAKLDTCYANATATLADDLPIALLFGGDSVRDPTGVFAFACTAGVDADTILAYGPVEVACGATTFTLDPSLPEGSNHTASAGTHVLHYGVYRTAEALTCDDPATAGTVESCAKRSWNLAVDLADLASLGPCTFSTRATAMDGDDGFALGLPIGDGVSYPYIDVSVVLGPACVEDALDDGGGVGTAYHGNLDGMPRPKALCHTWDGASPAAPIPGVACGVEPPFCGGSGTASDPYLICTIDDLAELDALLTDPATYDTYKAAYYEQADELDLGDVPHAFLPIGPTEALPQRDVYTGMFVPPSTRPFLGHYDGGWHELSGLAFVSSTVADHQALFAMLGDGAVVKDLEIEAPRFDLADSVIVGTVAAWSSGTISGIEIDGLDATLGHVIGFGGVVGVQSGGVGLSDIGVAGAINGSTVTASTLDAYGLPIADTNFVGGVAGVVINTSAAVTTTLDRLSVEVDIDVGGEAAGVASVLIGQLVLRNVEHGGTTHSRLDASGIAAIVADAQGLGVPGLQPPRLEHVVNVGDVHVTGSIANQTAAAGIARAANGAVFDDVHNRGDVTNDHLVFGGAAGLALWVESSVFTRVSSTGDISNRADQVDSFGNPATYGDVAGLVGYVGQTASLTMSDCFSSGALTGGTDQNDMGGLVADLWDLDTSAISIHRCYVANTFSGGRSGHGAVLGNVLIHAGSTPTFSFGHIYWNSDYAAPGTLAVGEATPGSVDASGFVALTTAAMQAAASFVDFDFTTVWYPPAGGAFPTLR